MVDENKDREMLNILCLLACGSSHVKMVVQTGWSTLLLLVFLSLAKGQSFWPFSSCNKDTKWKTGSGPAAIRSWMSSVVPTFDGEDPSIKRNLGTHFIMASPGMGSNLKVDTLIQNPHNPNGSIVWKAFGHRNIDGWLYGHIQAKGEIMTGSKIAYIYDDFETAILGQFKRRTLINGTTAKITAYRCKDGIMELKLEKLAEKQRFFTFVGMAENLEKLSKEEMDPIDDVNTYVAKSSVSTSAGEGLFAKRKIMMGSLIATYAGMLSNSNGWSNAPTLAEMENQHKNYISFNKTYSIDVPPPYDDLKKYRATLGHKANHSFDNNAKFAYMKHPRFGETRCLIAITNIDKDEEILADYSYDMDKFVPGWYSKLYEEEFFTRRELEAN